MPTALVDSQQPAATIEDKVVNEINKTAKNYIQQPCEQPNEGGDNDHPGVVSRQEFLQGFSKSQIVSAPDCGHQPLVAMIFLTIASFFFSTISIFFA